LYQEGYRIIALGRKDENKITCQELYTGSKVSWEDISHIDAFFHLAAVDDPNEKEDNIIYANYHMPISMFKKAAERGCTQFVYASSVSVYGNSPTPFLESQNLNPINFCAKSKIMFEDFASDFSTRNKISCVGLRLTEVFGTHESYKGKGASLINRLFKSIYKDENLKIFGKDTVKDWVYIKDVIDAIFLASKYKGVDIFNIGSGNSLTAAKVVEIINRKMKKNIRPEYPSLNTDKYQGEVVINIEKAKNKLKYHPQYLVEDGIEDLKRVLVKNQAKSH
jgi:nucleoside-diphosphate-sugar epimerase